MDARVTRAVEAGGVRELDARGLMPLAEARAVLRGATAFVKGEGQQLEAQYVLASDQLWAALLSLADGAEFVAVASRLSWQFHPRGFDNVDLHLRYGDAIVPWLATRVDGDGVLHNQPWCVVPCLLACDGAAAFELVMRVRAVAGSTIALARAWLERHPATAAALLAGRDDAVARAHLRGLELRGLVARTARPFTAADVLATLDAMAAPAGPGARFGWPALDGKGARRAHGFRAIAARDGADWGLAIERVEGVRPAGVHAARVAVFAYGSRIAGGFARAARPLAAVGPADGFAAWLSATTAVTPELVLGGPEASLPALGLAAARVVAVVPHLAHVGARPSESAVYRALAAALAA